MVGAFWPCGCCGGSTYYTLRKFNSSGVVQWQIDGGDGDSSFGDFQFTGDFHLNGDGTVVLCGARSSSGNGNGTFTISKWDTTDQSFIWGKDLLGAYPAPYAYISGRAIDADSSGNLWIGGEDEFLQINQSGTTISSPTIPSGLLRVNFNTIDSSDNHIATYYNNSLANIGNWMIKHNSSGTELWKKKIYNDPFTYQPDQIVTDGDDNIYCTGDAAAPPSFLLAQIDPDGDVVWQIDGRDDDYYFYAPIAIDGTDLYVGARHGTHPSFTYHVDIYDFSGTLQSSIPVGGQIFQLEPDGSGGVYVNETAGVIKRYNSSGTVLQSYTYGPSNRFTRSLHAVGSDLYVCGDRVEVT